MPKHPKHYPHPAPTHQRLPTGLETVDAQWKAYHRYAFRICAEHLSPSDELVQFALTIAESGELTGLIGHILDRKEALGLRADAIEDLTSAAGASESTPSPKRLPAQRLREVCFRVVRHNEVLHPTVVDYIVDTLDAAPDDTLGTFPPSRKSSPRSPT